MHEFTERDILKICYLYYQEEKTQEEISKIFGVSRFKISRTLKEAKKRKLVTITINDPKGDLTETEIKLADKYGPKYCYLFFHLITIPCAYVLTMTTNLSLIVVAGIYFFFLLGMQPSENTLVAMLTPEKLRHSAFGLKFILTFGVGAVSVKITSAIENAYTINAVFPLLGTISIFLVITIIILIYRLYRSSKT